MPTGSSSRCAPRIGSIKIRQLSRQRLMERCSTFSTGDGDGAVRKCAPPPAAPATDPHPLKDQTAPERLEVFATSEEVHNQWVALHKRFADDEVVVLPPRMDVAERSGRLALRSAVSAHTTGIAVVGAGAASRPYLSSASVACGPFALRDASRPRPRGGRRQDSCMSGGSRCNVWLCVRDRARLLGRQVDHRAPPGLRGFPCRPSTVAWFTSLSWRCLSTRRTTASCSRQQSLAGSAGCAHCASQ